MSHKNGSQLDLPRLMALAETLRDDYAQAEPFPHVVMDDFLPVETLEDVLIEFPAPGDQWFRFQSKLQMKKLASTEEYLFGARTVDLLRSLNSSGFLRFLETLTGIGGLIPDPHFLGGGLHQIEPGGFLKIHADFNRHPELHLDRRLNLLIYLNKNWSDDYGGHLELWSRKMKGCAVKVLPVFNRAVLFSTTDFAFHGHPEPLTCPEGFTRKSLALYYYTNGRPLAETSEPHTTLFQSRRVLGEQLEEPSVRIKRFAKSLIPPVITDAYRQLKRRKLR
jgi:hypothetical protein